LNVSRRLTGRRDEPGIVRGFVEYYSCVERADMADRDRLHVVMAVAWAKMLGCMLSRGILHMHLSHNSGGGASPLSARAVNGS
jgi:hypothetical protein